MFWQQHESMDPTCLLLMIQVVRTCLNISLDRFILIAMVICVDVSYVCSVLVFSVYLMLCLCNSYVHVLVALLIVCFLFLLCLCSGAQCFCFLSCDFIVHVFCASFVLLFHSHQYKHLFPVSSNECAIYNYN